MNIAIEQLELDELRSFLREQADDAFPDLKDEQRLNMLAEKWFDKAEFCTCRNAEGGLIGMIAFYANRPVEAVAYIPHVYVNRECRGKKIFTIMLRAIEEYVKNKGFGIMRLEVQKSNETAQRTYLHYGFSFFGEANGDSLYMQYLINND